MMYSKYLSGSLCIAALAVTVACSSTGKYPHEKITIDNGIGVYAQWSDNTKNQKIQESLQSLALHKMVMKAVMTSFPPRTNARVSPILGHQAIYTDKLQHQLDIVSTGKALNLDYVINLEVRSQLITTGFHYQEQWRPELIVVATMTEIKDGRQVLQKTYELNDKPFLKFLSAAEEKEALISAYNKLAVNVAEKFSDNIGPVIRTVSSKEKMIHEKIYPFGHIRKLANRDNCVISGDLTKELSDRRILYHVPCQDMTLTYACENETDNSRCWLQ